MTAIAPTKMILDDPTIIFSPRYQRLDGKNDAALDIEFIDAWEQLKINEPRLLKDCR